MTGIVENKSKISIQPGDGSQFTIEVDRKSHCVRFKILGKDQSVEVHSTMSPKLADVLGSEIKSKVRGLIHD